VTRYLDLLKEPQHHEPSGVPAPPIELNGQTHRYAAAALEGECQIVASASEGTRNDLLNRAWFKMGRHIGAGTIDVASVREALANAARAAGLPDKEIATALRDDQTSGLAAGSAIPRVPAPREELPELTVIEAPPQADLDAFWSAREVLGHIHAFARARRAGPWATLGVALARIVASTEPWIALPPFIGGPGSLNLFVGLVGKSGDGKGAATAAAEDAIHVADYVTISPGSGEGLIHAYASYSTKEGLVQHTTKAYFDVPEIEGLAKKSAAQSSTLMPTLRQIWSGEQIGSQTADTSRRVHVRKHSYRAAMVAGIQPALAASLLDDSDGGTPQRFIWLPVSDPGTPDIAPPEPEPMDIVDTGPVEVHTASGVRPMDVCALAGQEIDAARLARGRGEGDALDGHALYARLKVAAALALLERRRDVSEEDWQLAGVIMRVSDATRSRVEAVRSSQRVKEAEAAAAIEARKRIVVEGTLAEAAEARVCERIKSWLSDGAEHTWSEVRKGAIAGPERIYFEAAIGTLKRSGSIELRKQGKGTYLKLKEAE
jgi:hypothetical protein